MHELSVTENIFAVAKKAAEQAGAREVTRVNLVIGDLSSLVDESIQFYWDLITENTVCAGAKLEFRRIPAQFICLDCGNEYNIPQLMTPCPRCNSPRVKITAGEEFYVDSIEIEKDGAE